MRRIIRLAIFMFPAFMLAQTSYQRHEITSNRMELVNPREFTPDFNAQLYNLEAPVPDGNSYRSFLMRQKIKSAELFPRKENIESQLKTSSDEPIVGRGFRKQQKMLTNMVDVVGGIPSDNSLAVSNDGIVLSAINSWMYAYDAVKDTVLFPGYVASLKQFGGGGVLDNDFDPKLIYDPAEDRFILVYLMNNTPTNSSIRVCFSSTNNPLDPWYRYTLPGNPLNNNRWTDFPAISLTEDELMLTVNLIIPNVSWQVGFDGSVIWQIDKHAGYRGEQILNNTLWSDIRHNGRLIRNLHPIKGHMGNAATAFFMSNRNFDVQNDTLFLLHLSGTRTNPSTSLDIKAIVSAVSYGVPPNGRQADTNPNDPTSGLQTNDARVLGGITNGEWIQFVANTKNFTTGFSSIYHGFVTDLTGNPRITANIIGHPTRDYGYPNIAFSGTMNCEVQTMIGFNYTSPADFAGVGAIYFGNDSIYSDPIDLKKGENFADRHAQDYERWGDYFGIQPRFNNPGNIWMSGYFANVNKQNVTWIAEVFSPDTNQIRIEAIPLGHPSLCNAGFEINVMGLQPPYQFSYNNGPFTSAASISGFCEEQTVKVVVIDSKGCTVERFLQITKTVTTNPPILFPNPVGERMVVQFSLPSDQNLNIYIAAQSGQVLQLMENRLGNTGMNELVFYTWPLPQGTYFLRIEGDKGYSYKEKFIKLNP